MPVAVLALAGTSGLGTAAAAGGAGAVGRAGAARAVVLADQPRWATAAADRGPVAGDVTLTARVGLAERAPGALEAFARAVSTPGNPLYRHYLKPAQVRARFGPTKHDSARVRAWLTGAGLRVTAENSHWIDVAGPASAMQQAFGARIDTFAVKAPVVGAKADGAGAAMDRPGAAMDRPGAAGAADSTDTAGTALRRAAVGRVSVPADLAASVSSVAGLTQVARGAHEGATGARRATERVTGGHVGTPLPHAHAHVPGAHSPEIPSPGIQSAGIHATGIQATGIHTTGVRTPSLQKADSTPGAAEAASAPPCSASWGDATADGFPAAYSASTPYDVCGYIPAQLRGAYGVTASGHTGTGVTVAVVDSYGNADMLADANRYATEHGDRPFTPGQYVEDVTPADWTHTADGLCQTPGDWYGEQALDVEMVHGLAPGATVRYVGANSCLDQDLTAAMARIVDNRSADVVSGSFGETMHQTTGDIDPALVTQENAVFVTGAAEGIGFDLSTGDCGDDAAGLTGPNCDPLSARAQTEWPASSPWATAVGGTAMAATPDGRYQWETNMGDRRSVLSADGKSWTPFPGYFYFGGGGGTNEDFPQPTYQRDVVPYAMAHTLGSGATTTTAMRTVPDVAMDGDLLTAVFVGQTDPDTGVYSESQVGGTSVAAPEFAGLEAVAMEAQNARFGFANPMLYDHAGGSWFTDVVDHPANAPQDLSTVLDLGTNADGSRKVRLYQLGQDNGLHAGTGYDLATGLGSPRLDLIAGS